MQKVTKTTKQRLIDQLLKISNDYDPRILSNQTIAELKILLATEKDSGEEKSNQWCKIK